VGGPRAAAQRSSLTWDGQHGTGRGRGEHGIEALLTFLLDSEMAIDRVGVEGSAFLGHLLVLAMTAAGYDVREVQANRTADRRNRRRRAKTDIEDAEAMARESLADPQLPPAGEQRTRNPAWDTLPTTRDWPASHVLQRVGSWPRLRRCW